MYFMAITRKPTPRAKPLDLDRRARLLGVTPGHLSQVLSGKRQSANLMARLNKLIESEKIPTKGKNEHQ
jgi:predicted transcriptional regulator